MRPGHGAAWYTWWTFNTFPFSVALAKSKPQLGVVAVYTCTSTLGQVSQEDHEFKSIQNHSPRPTQMKRRQQNPPKPPNNKTHQANSSKANVSANTHGHRDSRTEFHKQALQREGCRGKATHANNFSVSHQTGLDSTHILWTTESKLLP